MARQCLFCANPADSKEHLWSEWILKGIPRTRPIQAAIGKYGPVEFRGDVQIKCVCTTCNNGWMSALEGEIKITVGAMVHDLSLLLTTHDQQSIAVWATKMAMVLEGAITYRSRYYSRTECEQLRTASTVPDRTLIWLGRIAQSGVFAAGTYIWLNDNRGETHEGCVATFTVGHLAMQVLTIRLPEQIQFSNIDLQCHNGPWNTSLIDIYPVVRTLAWPPQLSFSTHGFVLFTAFRDRWKIGRRLQP